MNFLILQIDFQLFDLAVERGKADVQGLRSEFLAVLVQSKYTGNVLVFEIVNRVSQ